MLIKEAIELILELGFHERNAINLMKKYLKAPETQEGQNSRTIAIKYAQEAGVSFDDIEQQAKLDLFGPDNQQEPQFASPAPHQTSTTKAKVPIWALIYYDNGEFFGIIKGGFEALKNKIYNFDVYNDYSDTWHPIQGLQITKDFRFIGEKDVPTDILKKGYQRANRPGNDF